MEHEQEQSVEPWIDLEQKKVYKTNLKANTRFSGVLN